MARRWAGGEEVRGGGEREQRCADTRPERRKEQLAACARWAAARVREGRRRGGGCNSERGRGGGARRRCGGGEEREPRCGDERPERRKEQ